MRTTSVLHDARRALRAPGVLALALAAACGVPRPSTPRPASTPMQTTAAPTSSRAATLAPGANRVTFAVDGDSVVGTLFLPPSYRPGERLPVVVVDGPWTQVKEQVGHRYGQRLAAEGLAAFALDHRGWGESGGVRSYESTARKVADLKAAIGALAALDAVDAERLGVLGVCAGAGVTAQLVAEDARVKAFATTAAWLQHPSTTPLFYGGAEGIARRVALSEQARARFERTGEVEYVKAYDPAEGSTAAMFFPVDYYGDAARGAIPQWRNEFAVMGWKEWLELDAIRHAARIRVPVLMVHSDGSALPDNVRRFHAELATPASDKRLVWVEGEHTQFYDREEQVSAAAGPVAAHFRATLGRAGAPAR
jgi:hypothetical protein